MKDLDISSLSIEYTSRTYFPNSEDFFSTTYCRKATISNSKKELIIGLFEACGAEYNSDRDIYILNSYETFRACESYLLYL